jgi:hypothetical protein
MNDKNTRIVVRILYVFILLFACYLAVDFMQDRILVMSDLPRWNDATAMVTGSELTYEGIALNHDKDPKGRRRSYKSYTVSYAYTAEFQAWGRVFHFVYKGSNSGKTDTRAEKPPESAYDFPKQGDVVSVIYDPDTDGSYRIGSKEEWQRRGEFSPGNATLIIICAMLVVAAPLAALDAVTTRKRRIADSGTHIPPCA